MSIIILFFTFSALAILSFIKGDLRRSAMSRTKDEWTADFMGLFIQGIFIPAVPFILVPVIASLFPSLDQRFELNPIAQFFVSFMVVDYFYYWNHRIFHKKSWWHIHRMHHTSRHLDLFATSRNSLITSLLFIYVWAQVAGLLLLRDNTAFMLGLGLTFALDLWRHSGLKTPDFFQSLIGWILILPEHHVLHHSVNGRNKNFGANFCWWDMLHGTYSSQYVQNRNLEKLSDRNIWKELILPVRAGK